VVKAQQASYHPLGTEPLQGLKVKVPEALVPLLRLIIPTSSKAEGLCYLHVEDIESIGASGYLGKKATMAIPNPHDSVLDLTCEPLSSSCPKLMIEFLNAGM
jgi:hypothetical protein